MTVRIRNASRQTDIGLHTAVSAYFIHKIADIKPTDRDAYQTDISSQPSVPRQTCLAYDCRNAARWETAYTA